MKFIIFGAGAIGSLFGGLLSAHNEVLLVGRKEHMEAIEKNGLRIEGITSGIFHPKTVWNGERYDMIILTTKSYDTRKALEEIMERFGRMPVLSLQNGLRNEKIIAEIMGEEYAIGGVTSHGAVFVEEGKIYHAGAGETIIGEMKDEMSERIKNIARAFNQCGIYTRISDKIEEEIWRKGVINASINSLTTLLGCKNGFLLKDKNARKLLEMVCRECISIAKKEGFDIEDAMEKTIEVADKTASNISSMLQDMMKGKRTEVEEINGEFVRVAKKHGMEAKINEFLMLAIKGMENVRHLGWPYAHESRRSP